ncbi:hypothetical protein L6452_16718 [Arctium lappa]|uniref:Uncharacterized protein n=1 Tax=Arctium lappa TaxID=4217 RepID=A0ACB9C1K0_ARCLA|nr:hypothetical protein L6452_16718 [Arctium lappa]
MEYYSKNTSDLAKIGKETFDLLDNLFPGGHNSKPPSSSGIAPPRRNPQQVFHYQYQPQQVYDAPVSGGKRTEKVINCNEAAKMYGGTMFVNYPKRKPARKELPMIRAKAFVQLDERNSKHPSSAPPFSTRTQEQVHQCQYTPQQAYFVQQVPAKRTEMVVDCYQATTTSMAARCL